MNFRPVVIEGGATPRPPATLGLPFPRQDLPPHLSVPAGVVCRAWDREADAAVWRYDAGPADAWHVQVCGITARIPLDLVDTYVALVVEIGFRNVSVPAAKRLIALMPGAFSVKRGAA